MSQGTSDGCPRTGASPEWGDWFNFRRHGLTNAGIPKNPANPLSLAGPTGTLKGSSDRWWLIWTSFADLASRCSIFARGTRRSRKRKGRCTCGELCAKAAAVWRERAGEPGPAGRLAGAPTAKMAFQNGTPTSVPAPCSQLQKDSLHPWEQAGESSIKKRDIAGCRDYHIPAREMMLCDGLRIGTAMGAWQRFDSRLKTPGRDPGQSQHRDSAEQR
jgi:hypothetical protein